MQYKELLNIMVSIQEQLGISRQEWADLAGITKSTLSRYLSQKIEPSASRLLSMIEALKVKINIPFNPYTLPDGIKVVICRAEIYTHPNLRDIEHKEIIHELNLIIPEGHDLLSYKEKLGSRFFGSSFQLTLTEINGLYFNMLNEEMKLTDSDIGKWCYGNADMELMLHYMRRPKQEITYKVIMDCARWYIERIKSTALTNV